MVGNDAAAEIQYLGEELSTDESNFHHLPVEIILIIFEYLSDKGKWNLACSSKYLLSVFNNWGYFSIIPVAFRSYNSELLEDEVKLKRKFHTTNFTFKSQTFTLHTPPPDSKAIARVTSPYWKVFFWSEAVYDHVFRQISADTSKEKIIHVEFTLDPAKRFAFNFPDIIPKNNNKKRGTAKMFIGLKGRELMRLIKAEGVAALPSSLKLTILELVFRTARNAMDNVRWSNPFKGLVSVPPIQQPEGFKVKLHDYQLKALAWYGF